MSNPPSARTPGAFWTIASILLLWGLAYAWLTLFAFYLATPEDWQALVRAGRVLPAYVDYIARIPGWVIALTALAAATRLLGALGLLARSAWALPCYWLSLCCVTVIMLRGFVFADVASVIRTSQIYVEALFYLMSVFAVAFSAWAAARQILR